MRFLERANGFQAAVARADFISRRKVGRETKSDALEGPEWSSLAAAAVLSSSS